MLTLMLCIVLFSTNFVDSRPANNDHSEIKDTESVYVGNTVANTIDKDEQTDSNLINTLYESDMKISPISNGNDRKRRAVFTLQQFYWPNGEIPYVFDTVNKVSDETKNLVKQSFDYIMARTCIRFIPRTNQANYVNVTFGSGCWSWVGRKRGMQELNLGKSCNSLAVIIHETLHALGFLHEHNRPDRDQYVTVNLNNLRAGADSKQFEKFVLTYQGGVSLQNLPYDKQSVMHYDRFSFSKHVVNGFVSAIKKEFMTIYSNADYREEIGNREMSNLDIRRVNTHYKCPTTTPTPTTTTAPSTTTTTISKQTIQSKTSSTIKKTETTATIATTLSKITSTTAPKISKTTASETTDDVITFPTITVKPIRTVIVGNKTFKVTEFGTPDNSIMTSSSIFNLLILLSIAFYMIC